MVLQAVTEGFVRNIIFLYVVMHYNTKLLYRCFRVTL